MEKQMINVKILRFDPTKDHEPYYQTYVANIDKGATVLSVLRDIYEQQDHSLSFYYSCRIGKCAGCQVTVNGKVRLACTEVVKGDIILDPQKNYKVIKDLYVDKTARLANVS